jgi:glycosyltransferase involved in cell wall biosynthesis
VEQPALSLVMPCYNEEAIVGQTVKRTVQAFRRAEIVVEIVTVDNGSRDSTPDVLARLAEEYPEVVVTRVPVNQGYGYGVLSGIPLCRGGWSGVVPADGQVDAEDAGRLFEVALATGEPGLA